MTADRPLDELFTVRHTLLTVRTMASQGAQVMARAVSLVSGASPEQRTALRRATEAFDAVLARQGRAIEAARTVTEGLVRAIADEVAAQRSENTGYGAKGVRAGGTPQRSSTFAAS